MASANRRDVAVTHCKIGLLRRRSGGGNRREEQSREHEGFHDEQ
jgi:hypothetical protein